MALSRSTARTTTAPAVLVRAKQAYALWLVIFNDFPKVQRGTLGKKIDDYFLELLESLFVTMYLPGERKLAGLGTAIAKLDSLKFLLQLAWESRCVPPQRYAALSEPLDEVGRMLGGWRKGLETKPASAVRS